MLLLLIQIYYRVLFQPVEHPMKEKISFWFQAIRPKTLTAAVVPFLAGSALAYRLNNVFSIEVLTLCLACSLLVQIATNLINDALDCERGGDTDQRLGPTRVCQAGYLTVHEVLRAGAGCLVLAALLGIPLILRGGPELALLFGASLVCAYAYTGGPFSISMNGLAEVFSFLFFGVFATMAAFYLQAGHWSTTSAVLGAQIGSLVSTISAINNYRDIAEDKQTGKRTLAVRLGPDFSRKLIACLALTAYPLGLYWMSIGLQLAFILPLILIALTAILIAGVYSKGPIQAPNKLLALSAGIHFLFGALLIVGLLL